MRVAATADVIETGGALQARKSSIKTSRKTFRMTIDGIYSDKFGSIVREIATNAFDSHQRAGQTKPFYVHAPNAIEPEFFVRDYGVGMSDALMEQVYIVLGESDKEATDEEVGMWGVGSKSPFAYADQYNITCYDGERVRHYGYGIAEDGVPTLYTMSDELAETAADKLRGVRIGFAVESKDFAAFEAAIQKAAVAHEGAFESNVDLKSSGEVAFEGAGWKAYKDFALKSASGRGLRWYARQGCVIYPIDTTQITAPADYSADISVVIDCPIGTVQVTTSREAISYEEEVVAYLTTRVAQVQEEIKNAVWEAVKDIESVVEFFATIAKIKPSFVPNAFIHPATGLTDPTIQLAQPTAVLNTKLTAHSRWDFETPLKIDLKTFKPTKLYVIDDISALLDPSREPTENAAPGRAWLSKSEIRRLARFTRAFVEKQGERDAHFIMNADWTAEFWAACFGSLKPEHLSFEKLRDAVPKRVVPPREQHQPPIRGVALAKAAGEQKPVFEITRKVDMSGAPAESGRGVAWVSSEQYRRQASALFKFAKRFGVGALYIAAPPSQPLMAEHKIPGLLDVASKVIKKDGYTFADWYYAYTALDEYQSRPLMRLLQNVSKFCPPETYTRLVKGKGEISKIAAAVRPMILAFSRELSEDDKKAVEALMLGNDGKIVKPEEPAGVKQARPLLKAITDHVYTNPTGKFMTSLPEGIKDPERLERLIDCLLLLQDKVPPSEPFR